jgi:hypothetical protein
MKLQMLLGASNCYLPMMLVYLDDIGIDSENPSVGELLAVAEFNDRTTFRKIYLRKQRLFKHAGWIDQVYLMHVLDHASRSVPGASDEIRALENPYP